VKVTPRCAIFLISVLLLAPSVSEGAQFLYTNINGSIKITKYTGPDVGVVIPGTIAGLPVTVIGAQAFQDRLISNVTIPDSVTTLENFAFALCGLTNVVFGTNITTIGEGAFSGCGNLRKIAIPKGISSLGPSTFANCGSLAQITVPDNIVSISASAFANCAAVSNISLGKGVLALGELLFPGCTGLKAINVDPLNPVFSNSDGVLFNKSQSELLFYPPAKADSTYTISDTVTNIAPDVFRDPPLSSLSVSDQNPSYAALDGVLFNKDQTELIRFPRKNPQYNYVVPDSVTTIGDGAFCNASGLYSISAPEVRVVGDRAFDSCPVLWQASFRDLVEIKGQAFVDCRILIMVDLGDKLTIIGTNAFYGCDALESITVPRSVQRIDSKAFADCPALERVYFLGDAVEPAIDFFEGSDLVTVFYLPTASDWSSEYSGRPALPFQPQTTASFYDPGKRQFTFTIGAAPSVTVVVEFASDLSNAVWTPIATNILDTTGALSVTNLVGERANGFYRFVLK
jgi:hypothetical protein